MGVEREKRVVLSSFLLSNSKYKRDILDIYFMRAGDMIIFPKMFKFSYPNNFSNFLLTYQPLSPAPKNMKGIVNIDL